MLTRASSARCAPASKRSGRRSLQTENSAENSVPGRRHHACIGICLAPLAGNDQRQEEFATRLTFLSHGQREHDKNAEFGSARADIECGGTQIVLILKLFFPFGAFLGPTG